MATIGAGIATGLGPVGSAVGSEVESLVGSKLTDSNEYKDFLVTGLNELGGKAYGAVRGAKVGGVVGAVAPGVAGKLLSKAIGPVVGGLIGGVGGVVDGSRKTLRTRTATTRRRP